MSEPDIVVERLRALLPKVTAGPWFQCGELLGDQAACDCGEVWAPTTEDCGYLVALTRGPDEPPEFDANAAFIALCREGVPALLAEIRSLREQLSGREGWLGGFKTAVTVANSIKVHPDWGPMATPDDGLDLGLKTARRVLAEALERYRSEPVDIPPAPEGGA